jgi:hypothetical protein
VLELMASEHYPKSRDIYAPSRYYPYPAPAAYLPTARETIVGRQLNPSATQRD